MKVKALQNDVQLNAVRNKKIVPIRSIVDTVDIDM